ncbi:MAG: GH3 auxin-responsive promoter family protein, partial [Burkholderiales bacterium]
MNVKTLLSKPLAAWVMRQQQKWMLQPGAIQQSIFKKLVSKGRSTLFGAHHAFDQIKDYKDYQARVPIREYEEFLPYIEKIKRGGQHILWPGKPIYWAKTSGTTAGNKYIPIT